jgi:hypothetical protein
MAFSTPVVRSLLTPHLKEEDMIVLKAAQQQLLGALQAVSGIVERRHTLPILANVLLRKNGASTELTTSDLEIQVRTTAELGGDEAPSAPRWARAS